MRILVIQYNPNNYVEPIIELIEKGTPVLLVTRDKFEKFFAAVPIDRRFVNTALFELGIENFVVDRWMIQ